MDLLRVSKPRASDFRGKNALSFYWPVAHHPQNLFLAFFNTAVLFSFMGHYFLLRYSSFSSTRKLLPSLHT
jgi:hypothetical protein